MLWNFGSHWRKINNSPSILDLCISFGFSHSDLFLCRSDSAWVKVKQLPKHLLISWSNKCLKPVASSECPSPAPELYPSCCVKLCDTYFVMVAVEEPSAAMFICCLGSKGTLNDIHLNWVSYLCHKSSPVTVRALNLFLGRNWKLLSGSKIHLNWIWI